MTAEQLMALAQAAAAQAYCPYSGFAVGAALLCADGAVYTGCNIENAAYSPTVCAERTAFFKAVQDGKREFTAIAVWAKKPATPCGVCRQVMAEFCSGDFAVYLRDEDGIAAYRLDQLLPHSFSL